MVYKMALYRKSQDYTLCLASLITWRANLNQRIPLCRLHSTNIVKFTFAESKNFNWIKTKFFIELDALFTKSVIQFLPITTVETIPKREVLQQNIEVTHARYLITILNGKTAVLMISRVSKLSQTVFTTQPSRLCHSDYSLVLRNQHLRHLDYPVLL